MKSVCACLAVLPVAASASGRFVDSDSNLVLLQRHAEAKTTAAGGTKEKIWPFDQLYGETQKVFGETQKAFDQLLGRREISSEVEAPVGTEVELSTGESSAQDEWHFCGAEVSSNLGGLGPDLGAPRELRYKRVLKLPGTGQELDLVVTNTTEYSVKDLLKNGEQACFGRINIKSPGSLTMQFKLVATGTDNFVDDLDHDFTVMDLDHSKAGMMESITTSGFDGTPISVITPVLAADGVSYTFEGLDSAKAITDPRSPWNLTQPQRDASVGFKFSGRDSWEVTYNTWDDTGLAGGGGRNFLFTGKTSLQDPNPCGQEGTMDTETGECVIYQDPHIDGFDNPRNGPFLTRISSWDMQKSHTSLLGSKAGLTSWSRDDPPSIDVNEYERGDFWLVKNAQVSIQGRYDASEEFPGGRSGLAALAVGGSMLDGGIITLEPKRGAIAFFGKTVDDVADHKHETTTGLVAIKTSYDGTNEDGEEPSNVELTLPSGVFVHVRRYNTHLDAKIMVPRQLGNIDGQCGNWNGDATDDSLDAISERMGSTKVLESELLFAKSLNHGRKCEDWCSAELFTRIETNKSVIKNLTAWSMKCEWYHCSQCSVCDGISRPSPKQRRAVNATRPSLREHQGTQARCEDWCSSTVFEVQRRNVTSTKKFFWDTKCSWRNCGGCPGCDKRLQTTVGRARIGLGAVSDDELELYVKADVKTGQGLGADPRSHQIMMVLGMKHLRAKYIPVNTQVIPSEFKQFCDENGVPQAVPILKHGEYVVYNTDDIIDYIDKEWPEPDLLSANEMANKMGLQLYPRFSSYLKSKDPVFEEKLKNAVLDELKKINNFLGSPSSTGKFLDGDSLKEPDAYLLPKLQNVKVALKRYKNLEIPDDLSDLHQYMDDASREAVFSTTCPSDEAIIEDWKKRLA